MKRKFNLLRSILIFIGLVSVNIVVYAQDTKSDCRVLLHTIKGKYTGECKDGFAHGKGFAQGKDKYEGSFKKGLPNGIGTYTWANGNTYSGGWKKGQRSGVGTFYSASNGESVKGTWKKDEFIKEYSEPSYKVLFKSNIEKTSFYESKGGVPGTIEIEFRRDGNKKELFNYLFLNGTSGMSEQSSNFIGFKGVLIPFEGSIKFQAPSRTGYNTVNYSLDFKIVKEGSWKIVVNY